MGQLTNDQIGSLGELIAAAALSRPVGGHYERALFRAIPLGDKYPVADFLVALLNADGSSGGFFFVQVKSTNRRANGVKNIEVKIRTKDFNALVQLPVPTYIVAVNIAKNEAYLAAAIRERRTSVSRIGKSFNLADESVRIALYQEVLSFWESVRPIAHQTRFDHDR